MKTPIISRILREVNSTDLMEILVERLSPTDLQSVLLEVTRQRVSRYKPRDLLQRYATDRFVRPAQVNVQALLEFERLAYRLLPDGFEVIELSPLCPSGTNSTIATVDQNKVVTTIRNTEVAADSTNILALECALRRRQDTSNPQKTGQHIRLCTSQRVVRAQAYRDPTLLPHFRLISLVTAGHDLGSYRFECEALLEQIDYYLKLMITAQADCLPAIKLIVSLTALDESCQVILQELVHNPLINKYSAVEFGIDQQRQSGRGYYQSAAFQIDALDQSGKKLNLIDGGFTDWTQKLLSNCKERLLISGLGTERYLSILSTRPDSNPLISPSNY
jgi:hypothetical protein